MTVRHRGFAPAARNAAARLVALGLLAAGPALAAGHAQAADPPQDKIVGQDAMGDKSRGGPDGFSWAPVSRDQAASGKAVGETAANVKAAPNAQPDETGKKLPAGQDPGTPASSGSNGPAALSAPAASRTP